jgi:hypothetical protein
VREAFAQPCCSVEVIDGEQRVVPADVADPATVELAGQPLAAVDVDLALVRDPALDAHVHEPELVVDDIQVVVQALPFPAEQLETACLVTLANLEAPARLDRADQTDDPLGDPVGLGDRFRQLVFVLGAVAGLDVIERDHRSTGVGHQLAGIVGDPLRRRLRVGREILECHTLGPREAAGPVLLVQGAEMTLEDHPVEHRQAARDPIPMKLLERAHHCTSAPSPARQVSLPPHVRAQGWLRQPDNHPHHNRGAHWLRPSEARLP